jgi:hypothetical protein
MTRKRTIAGPDGIQVVDLTPEEEAAEDAAQKIYDDAEPARAMEALRKERNAKLAASDWMANSDVTMSDAWKSYRQALRDLPANTANPAEVTWPTAP